MKVLITGSSGYIGSHLVNWLSKKKYTVHGLDTALPKLKTAQYYNIDINGGYKWIEKFDCIVHLAALVKVGESAYRPLQYYQTNLNGTINLIRNIPTKNFIFASTGSAEYCVSPYAVSKRAAEDCIKEYYKTSKNNYTIFRFYNVIGNSVVGPTNPDGIFYNLKKSTQEGKFTIYGNDYDTPDGTPIRDYVHVDEICASIEKAILEPSNNIENLGHGQGHSVLEIVNKFMTINNLDLKIEFGERRIGDLERSVLNNPSKYMQNLYNIDDMLKV